MNIKTILHEILKGYDICEKKPGPVPANLISTSKAVNAVMKAIEKAEKKDRRDADEFEIDRLSEPPGLWKSSPGFVGPGGWRS